MGNLFGKEDESFSKKRKREDSDTYEPNKKIKLEDMDLISPNVRDKIGLVKWLEKLLPAKSRLLQPSLQSAIASFGAEFEYAPNPLQSSQLFGVAVNNVHYKGNKDFLRFPFVTGAPGIGKTRMLWESLNQLKYYASTVDPNKFDYSEACSKLQEALTSDDCILIYVTFSNGTSWTTTDTQTQTEYTNPDGPLAARILWELCFKEGPFKSYDDYETTVIVGGAQQHLTVRAILNRLRSLQVRYLVLAVDEITKVDKKQLNTMLKSVANELGSASDFALGIFGGRTYYNIQYLLKPLGTLYSPFSEIIHESIGQSINLAPSLLSTDQVDTILDALASKHSFLLNWRCVAKFRQCLSDVSNPVRALDYFLGAVADYASKYPEHELQAFDYLKIMTNTLDNVNAKMMKSIPPKDAEDLLYFAITRQSLGLTTTVQHLKQTLEELAQNCYVFLQVASPNSVHVVLPFYYVYNYLSNSSMTHMKQFFSLSWDNMNFGPDQWEEFNVLYLTFKMNIFSKQTSFSYEEFHNGAIFGSDKLRERRIASRYTSPMRLAHQFPLTPIDTTSYFTNLSNNMVCNIKNIINGVYLNAQGTRGIDSFFVVDKDTIEFQQYKSYYTRSNTPSKLTQQEIDSEYTKVNGLFKKHLRKSFKRFVLGIISSRRPQAGLVLQENMYVVHRHNLEDYYGPTFAGLAQLKAFYQININTAQLKELQRVFKKSAQTVLQHRPYKNWAEVQQKTGLKPKKDVVISF